MKMALDYSQCVLTEQEASPAQRECGEDQETRVLSDEGFY